MVILLALTYIAGIVLFATFLVTRRYLRRRQGNAVSRIDKCLNSLNWMSYLWISVLAPMFVLMELIIGTMQVFVGLGSVEFLSDMLSLSPGLWATIAFMYAVNTIMILVHGYRDDPRGDSAPAKAASKRWLWTLTVLFAIAAIVGILTGILV